MNNIKSVARSIKGYSDYMITDDGCVISLKNPALESRLSGYTDYRGYLRIWLCQNSTKRCFKIHRLVAEAFIPNPENKRTVNHKNGIRSDNRVENLEWATYGENIEHSYRSLGRKLPAICGSCLKNPRSKTVNQYTKSGVFVASFPCVAEASRNTAILKGNIANVCRGVEKSAGGFLWKYEIAERQKECGE